MRANEAALSKVGERHPRNLRACSSGQAESGKCQHREACEAETKQRVQARIKQEKETGQDRIHNGRGLPRVISALLFEEEVASVRRQLERRVGHRPTRRPRFLVFSCIESFGLIFPCFIANAALLGFGCFYPTAPLAGPVHGRWLLRS